MTRKDQYDALVMALKLGVFCRAIGKEDEAIALACHIAELLTEEELDQAKLDVENWFQVAELSPGGERRIKLN
jgi:hypothetical protein